MGKPIGLSAAEAVPTIAKAMGQPLSIAETLVRQMQRAAPPLFPAPKGRGGGRNAALHSLDGGNNLAVGLALAGLNIADRTALIPHYRCMPALPSQSRAKLLDRLQQAGFEALGEAIAAWHHAVGAEDAAGLIPGSTTGEGLDCLVDWESRPEGQAIRRWFRTYDLSFDVGVGYARPVCEFAIDLRSSAALNAPTLRKSYQSQMWPAAEGEGDLPGLTLTARMHCSVFEILADLWSEARPPKVGYMPSSSGSLQGKPEQKSAGGGASNTNPALPLDQPDETFQGKSLADTETSARARSSQALKGCFERRCWG